MLKINRNTFFKIALVFLVVTGLCACQSQYTVTPSAESEAALVANSFENGLTTELDITYEQAFRNLKGAYQRCIAFTGDQDFVFTDNKLETHLEMGTLFARSDGGVYLHKATVEGLRDNKTRFTLYLPSNYPFAKSRFKQDIQRALGKDDECNI